jgi:hypothetical protein
MAKVDELQDSVDHRVPDGDQGVRQADGDTANQLLNDEF